MFASRVAVGDKQADHIVSVPAQYTKKPLLRVEE
jgi:hypothetical protein